VARLNLAALQQLRTAGTANGRAPGHNHRAMKIHQRLTSIWSLARRGEVTVRIHYRVREPQARTGRARPAFTPKNGCRIFELKRVEEMEL
jgi:hypothetical protein